MATMSKVKAVTDAPPSYETIFPSVSSAHSGQCTGNRLSIFSFLRIMQNRKSVLSRIRDIVSGPNFIPSSVTPIVRACADALSPAVFSHLLQTRNIEGHTALYWAIVNNRREVFSAFSAFIPRFSSVGCSDLRLACMTTNDQALFTQLNLAKDYSPKDGSLRRSFGCPPDEVQVHEGDVPEQFIAHIHIKMFQKRLCITRSMGVEFLARGRIWRLHFHMQAGNWWIAVCPSRDSPPWPTHINCNIMIKSGELGCATQPADTRWWNDKQHMLYLPMGNVYWCFPEGFQLKDAPKSNGNSGTLLFLQVIGDWVISDNTEYVDRDGTLHAAVEITLW